MLRAINIVNCASRGQLPVVNLLPSTITTLQNAVKPNNQRLCRTYCTVPEEGESKKDISKAMKAYLERAKEYDDFMQSQRHEYQLGKRHLANMMGEDPETFSQADIDTAIEYLFPSGLFQKTARPMMRSPEEVFPQRKAAEFDQSGRPHHFLFYTGKCNFYNMLYNIVEQMNNLNKFEDSMIRKGLKPDQDAFLELSGYKTLEKVDLEKKIVETVTDKDYNQFVEAIERLCSLPYSYKIKEFILEYKRPLVSQITTMETTKPKYDESGRAFITTYECRRKNAKADVTIRSPGTGKITINDQPISYFEDKQSREQVRTF